MDIRKRMGVATDEDNEPVVLDPNAPVTRSKTGFFNDPPEHFIVDE